MTDRTRTVTWQDPHAAAAAGRRMAGIDYLRAMMDGTLPVPPALLTLGATMATVDDSRVTMAMEPGEYLYNPLGTVHGGMIAILLDSVMGCAVHATLPAGRGYTTLEFKVNFIRPVSIRTGTVTGVGTVIHAGRRSAVAEGRLLDASGRLYATASTTCLLFDLPPA